APDEEARPRREHPLRVAPGPEDEHTRMRRCLFPHVRSRALVAVGGHLAQRISGATGWRNGWDHGYVCEVLDERREEGPLRLGRYVLSAPIAHGGMARVHVARLLGQEGFSRVVAVKRLHPYLAEDREFVGMFLDEARLASRIHHPNVVTT